MIEQLVNFVRDYFQTDDFIPLHEPIFGGKERRNVADAIESAFVSSVGNFVQRFEQVEAYSGAESAIATVNGTAAAHCTLLGGSVVIW